MYKWLKFLLTLAVAVLIISTPGLARDWYVHWNTGVDAAGRDGSDVSTQWFKTINYAIQRASSNDVIIVYGEDGGVVGPYVERVEIPTSKNHLTIRAEDPLNKPIIEDGLDAAMNNQAFGIYIKSDNSIIQNLIIRGFTAATDASNFTTEDEGGVGIYMDGGLSGNNVTGCVIYNCNWGIYALENSRTTIQACTIGTMANPIIDDVTGDGGIGITIWSNATTIERNIIGSLTDPLLGNAISFCDVDGIRVGFSTAFGGSADRTEIGNNNISNIGTLTDGYALNIIRLVNTVNIAENTIIDCVNGLNIDGKCFDVYVKDNLFQNVGNGTYGTETNVLVRAYNNGTATVSYDGGLLYDIWKRNNNQFVQGSGDLYNNSAAVLEAAVDKISRSRAPLGDYMFIRNTIQSAWDNDVNNNLRLGIKGYNASYPTVGTTTSFVYFENPVFDTYTGVEIFGENDDQPSYTVIQQSNSDVCALGGDPYGTEVLAASTEIHGLNFRGVEPAANTFCVNVLVNAASVNLNHNLFEVTNATTGACRSTAIANLPTSAASEVAIDGLYIHHNQFTHYGTVNAPIFGYNGIYINHFDNGETYAADDKRINHNMFGGYLYNGIVNEQSGLTINENTISTSLTLSGNGDVADGEGNYAIYIFDTGSTNTEQDNINITCNVITGNASNQGFQVGMYLGAAADGQELDLVATSNVIENSYLGIFVGSAAPYAAGTGVQINNNDFSFNYDVATPAGTFYNGAMDNTSATEVDAENNWWGAFNGPRHVDNTYNVATQGEKAQGVIDFVPWWAAAPTGTCPLTSTMANFGPVELRDDATESIQSYHTSIQDAIDAATNANGIIWAKAGTYTENIDFNSAANSLFLKGKKLDGLNNAYLAGTAGADGTNKPTLTPLAAGTPLVSLNMDNVSIQGFGLDGNNTGTNVSVVIDVANAPINNLLLQYNTFFLDAGDAGINIEGGNGLTNSTITYNYLDGAGFGADAWWFNILSGTSGSGGYATSVTLSNNDVNFATARLGLSSAGEIDDITFDANTFNGVNGGILFGEDEDDAPAGAVDFSNILITNNIFNDGPAANEYAVLFWNAAAANDIAPLVDADFGGNLSTFRINYNQILMGATGTYKAVEVFGTTNTLTGDVNAQSNWWGTQYGPRVLLVSTDLNSGNSWWDEVGNGADLLGFPVQRSSWNQAMQTVTCGNADVDFFPWWSATTGPDFNGPITLLVDGVNATYYPTFWDAVSSGLLDEDGTFDVIQAVAGTYTEDFGVWFDEVELRGASDFDPSQTVIQFTRTATLAADREYTYGLVLQKPAAQMADVTIHGFTFKAPEGVAGEYHRSLFLNAQNVEIYNNAFEVYNSDNTSDIGVGIINNASGFETPNTYDTDGLNIHDNTFTHRDAITNNDGYFGIYIYDQANTASTISNNTFGGLCDNAIAIEQPNFTIASNTISTTQLLGSDGTVGAGEGWAGIRILNSGTVNATISGVTISCNTITGASATQGFVFGILAPNTDGGGADYAATITIKNNQIGRNWDGIYIADNASAFDIAFNTFVGGFGQYAVNNTTGSAVDAAYNFWNSVYGPDHSTNAFGTSATRGWDISDDVTYLPFWTAWTNNCPGDAVGPELVPVIEYTNNDQTGFVANYASIDAALSAAGAGNYLYCADGTFTESVTNTQGQVNYLQSAGTTTIDGSFDLDDLDDIRIEDPFKVTGNLTFAGSGLTSYIRLYDEDFEVRGSLSGTSAGSDAAPANYIETTGDGYFVKGNVSFNQNIYIPTYNTAFFPVQITVRNTSYTTGNTAKLKARVDGVNPVTNYSMGEVENPIDNTWYIMSTDENDVEVTNTNSDVYFYFPDNTTWPDGFTAGTIPNTEVDGCWDAAEVQRNVYGARWQGANWESRKANSDAPAGGQCRVQQVNTFSPWGVFWGYSSSALVDAPDHADNLQFIGVTTNSIKIRVNRGTGDRFLVIVKEGEGPLDCWDCFPGQGNDYPKDGTDYSLTPFNVNSDHNDASWDDGYPIGTEGARIVFASNATDDNREILITELEDGTKYFVQVIEYNGAGTNLTNYNVQGWCNLDLASEPENNGRWRMTVPVVNLAFKVPPQDSDYLHDACQTWQDYFYVSGSGEAPWNIKYTDGVTTFVAGLVDDNNPYFQAIQATTESRTYSLVLVKDAGQRLCETTGEPVLNIHTPTDYGIDEIVSSPNPACNGAATVTFTPDVTGTDAVFSRWTVDYGAGEVNLNSAGGTLTGTGTAYTINTTTGELELANVVVGDNGRIFKVYFTGSETCEQDLEVASAPETLTVNAGPVPGSLSSVQTMPVCPSTAVTLQLSGVNADDWTWQRSQDNGATWADIAGLVNTTTASYIIPAGNVTLATGLSGGANQNEYRVIANRAGCAAETTAVWELVVRQAPSNWAGNNANIQVVSRSTGSMTISWDAASGATSYEVDVYNSVPTLIYDNLPSASTSLTIPLLDCNDFSFTVTAKNICGTANTTSNQQTFTSYCPTITLDPIYSCPTGYDFGNVYVGAISGSTLAYEITGQDLSANVTVTLPGGGDFEIRASSDNGGTWTPDWQTGNLSLDYTVINDGDEWDVQVRFRPQAANTYNCVAITHASTGVATQSTYVSAVGINNSPTTQATQICFANIADEADQTIDVSWVRGNGEGLIVVVSADQTWEALGTSNHPVGQIAASNDYVIYNGTSTSIASYSLANAGISANQDFYVRAYEYNEDLGLYYYNVSTSSQNPNLPKFFAFTTQPTVGQDINSGSNFTVVVAARTRDGGSYLPSVNETFTLTKKSGQNGTVTTTPASPSISSGTGNSGNVIVNWTYGDGQVDAQLEASKSCDWVSKLSNAFDIIPSTPSTQSRTMIVTGFANCGAGEVDINLRWTNGNGLHRILVVRQGQVPANPDDGDYYADVDGDFDDAGIETVNNDGASYVADRIDVDNPNGTYNATVENLPINTTFYFRVFDYNGNAAGITRYNTNTASFNPISRRTPNCKAGAGDFYVDADNYFINSFNRKAYINWDTYIEQGIVGYELYRADAASLSEDYTLVGSYMSDRELEAGLNSFSTRKYKFTDDDASLQVGNEYIYRLIATAIDGSKIDIGDQTVVISTLDNPNTTFVISDVNPNPAVDNINFDIELDAEAKVTVEVLEVSGKLVMSPVVGQSYNAGKNNIRINLGDIANGTYILHVSTGSESAIYTFIVNR